MTEPDTAADSYEHPWLLFEVTRRCDFRCLYCYASQRVDDEELSLGVLEQILDRLTTQVIPQGITLIGGEPLLVEGIEDLICCIRERGIFTAISTKASSLDAAAIARLKRAGLGSVEVSLDSLEALVYQRLMGVVMPRVQSAVAALVASGMVVTVGVMLTRLNLNRLEELLELCFALGVTRVSLNQMAQVGSGLLHGAIGLNDDELALVLERANASANRLGLRVGVGLPVEPCRISHERFPSLDFEACHCGERKWLVEPSGNVRTCELASAPIGNLLRSSWRELIASEAATQFRRHKHEGRCAGCKHWQKCRGGCRFRCGGPRANRL